MKFLKRIALIAALALLFQGLGALGADTALEGIIQTAMGNDALVEAAVLSQSSLLLAIAENLDPLPPLPPPDAPSVSTERTETEATPRPEPEALPVYRPGRAGPLPTLALRSGDDAPSAAGIYVRNHTTYEIDVEALLADPLRFDPGAGGPAVLILHTHGTEAFEPDEDDWYDNVDNYRTTDKRLNITRVGREVAAIFEARGLRVFHSQEFHDYPAFRGSYGRSLATAQQYLEAHPEIQIIIDIHRDAILNASGQYVRTMADIKGVESAQVMLVVGTDHAGLSHPYWRENLKFALQLQAAMVARYPTLARPLSLREERFNAHLAPGAVLVEIGTCANTLQEALTAARLFAEITADVILGSQQDTSG